ncbi:MAG: hypothetical protein QOK28_2016 [Actinomycetota bacterium]
MSPRYFTIEQTATEYPVLTERLIRRLIAERRIPFSKAGRRVILREDDIVGYLDAARVEPPRLRALSTTSTRRSAPQKGAPTTFSSTTTRHHNGGAR